MPAAPVGRETQALFAFDDPPTVAQLQRAIAAVWARHGLGELPADRRDDFATLDANDRRLAGAVINELVILFM